MDGNYNEEGQISASSSTHSFGAVGGSAATPTSPPTPSSTAQMFGMRTREWIQSFSAENHHNYGRQKPNNSAAGQRMPDLLIDQSPLEHKRAWIGQRDPIQIEKSNLVNILKLVIKEVIDSSLRFGRQLDSDHIPLQHFFIVLEHVLKHGLRPKKGLLGPKKELWDLLQCVEKQDVEAVDITASVRELPTVKSAMGRARAWLRLAVMQKKLADYFRGLVDQGDALLSEFYESRALLRSEEAAIVTGLLLSLNIVDCNLCVKEEDLECQQGVIDFSLYLRNNRDVSSDSCEEEFKPQGTMSAVLDQKNYIEELNRHLNTTVTTMQAKVESLSTTNALMKEDLSQCKSALFRAQEENRRLLTQMDRTFSLQHDKSAKSDIEKSSMESSPVSSSSAAVHDHWKTKLQEEIKRKEDLQKELGLQRSMKAEMEMAMKLLEKDVHEKQDTIISLRDQLEDIKQINLELYTKLQECEKSLKHKSELIARLEGKTTAMADTLQKLDEKYVQVESEKRQVIEELSCAKEQLLENEEKVCELEGDLKIEREWRVRLQNSSIQDKEAISNNQSELEFLRTVANDYDNLRGEHAKLTKKVSDDELTMEELAQQLSRSKLQIDSLREEQEVVGGVAGRVAAGSATWQDDSGVNNCQLCEKEFSIARRKHHCRHCGGIFCDPCSDNKLSLASSAKPVRVCDRCYTLLIDRFAK